LDRQLYGAQVAHPFVARRDRVHLQYEEEAKLRDKGYQRRMAEAIFQGLKRAAPRLIASRGIGGASLQAASPSLSPVAPAAQSAQAVPIFGAREHIVKPARPCRPSRDSTISTLKPCGS